VISPLYKNNTAVDATGVEIAAGSNYIENGIFQCEITGVATVVLEGKVAADAPWSTIVTKSASDAVVVKVFPYLRATITAYTSGNVSAWFYR
jgi:hypothetical protein